MKKCLVCGFETNNNEMMFCGHCGNKLSEKEITVSLKFDRSNLPFIKDGFENYLDNAEEAYATKNTVNLGVNLRVISENILEYAFSRYSGIQQMNFNDQLEYIEYNNIIDKKNITLINNIRIEGNKCAHGNLDYNSEHRLNYEFEEFVKEFGNIIEQVRSFAECENTPVYLYKSKEDYDNAPLLYRDKKAYAKKLIGIYENDKLERLVYGLVFAGVALYFLWGIAIAVINWYENVFDIVLISILISGISAFVAYSIIFSPKIQYENDQKGYEYKTLFMDFSKIDHYASDILVDYSINWKDLKKMKHNLEF